VGGAPTEARAITGASPVDPGTVAAPLAPLGPVDGRPGAAVREVPARALDPALDPDREEADPAVDPVEPIPPAPPGPEPPGVESPAVPDAGTPITGTVSDEVGETSDARGSALSAWSALSAASVFASALDPPDTGVGVAVEATGVGVTGGVELATGLGV
jgi:hypothetical protein